MIERKIAVVTEAGRLKEIGAAICLKLAESGFDPISDWTRGCTWGCGETH